MSVERVLSVWDVAGKIKCLDVAVAVGRQRRKVSEVLAARRVEHFNELHATVGAREHFLDLPEVNGGREGRRRKECRDQSENGNLQWAGLHGWVLPRAF